MRPMRVAHQWNLFHKQAWLNERALCTPSSLSPRILSIIQLRVMRVSRGTKIHDFLLDKRLASIFERNFTIKILSLYYISVVEIDWLIKWEERERRVFFFSLNLRARQEFSRREKQKAGSIMQSGFARCRINDSVYRMQASRNWTAPRARRVFERRQPTRRMQKPVVRCKFQLPSSSPFISFAQRCHHDYSFALRGARRLS